MEGVIWKGSPNHYNGRNGYKVTHITLHIMVGYLAGTDATFAKASSKASAHYGVGATGEIHQYVDEANGSYSDANYASNNSCISIEHEGGMAQGAVCTQACVDASARLCADIARRYGWDHLWHDGTRGNVWLHREIPGTDHAGCPDLAPNGLPYQQVIDKANAILKGEDMTTPNEIWDYGLGTEGKTDNQNEPAWVHLSWAHADTAKLRAMLCREDDVCGDGTTGDLYTRVCYMDKRIREMEPVITAQAAAIEALSKAMGADPQQIAKAVEDAVKAKLDSLEIKVTAD